MTSEIVIDVGRMSAFETCAVMILLAIVLVLLVWLAFHNHFARARVAREIEAAITKPMATRRTQHRRICSKCSEVVRDGAGFCGRCGGEVAIEYRPHDQRGAVGVNAALDRMRDHGVVPPERPEPTPAPPPKGRV